MRAQERGFPSQENDLDTFGGSLFASLSTGGSPKLWAASLPNYLSGIKVTYAALWITALPTVRASLRLRAVCAGCTKVSVLRLQPTVIRISIPAHSLYSVLNWTPPLTTMHDLHDAALLIIATVFELRGNGVHSVLDKHTKLDDVRFQVLMGSLKYGTQEAALRCGGRSFYSSGNQQRFRRSVY